MGKQSKYLNEAERLVYANEHEKAIEYITAAVSDESENPDLYSLRGVSFFHLNEKMKALDDMNKAQELQPEYGYRYASRAFIRDSMGDVRGAVEDYKIAVKLDPDDAIAHNNLGLLEEKLGYVDKAKTHFSMADQLAKAQDLNRQNSDDFSQGKEDEAPINLQKELEESRKTKTIWSEMKEVFTSKETRNEFLIFIRKGFKK